MVVQVVVFITGIITGVSLIVNLVLGGVLMEIAKKHRILKIECKEWQRLANSKEKELEKYRPTEIDIGEK